MIIGAIFQVLSSTSNREQLEIVHFMTVFHAMQKSIILKTNCKITADPLFWQHLNIFLPGKKGLRLKYF